MAQAKRKEKSDERDGAVSVGTGTGDDQNPGAPTSDWQRPAKLSTLARVVLVATVLLFNLPMLHYFLFRGAPAAGVNLPYSTDFSDFGVVERDFFSTGGLWRTLGGELLSPGVKNNPLWLKAKLPQNVAVEFDARSMSPEGDVKVEIFGDGTDHASGYVLIQGGWNNSLSIIARLDEHGQPYGAIVAEAGRIARERRAEVVKESKNLSEQQLNDKLKDITDDPVQTGVFRADTRMRVEITPSIPVQLGKSTHWRIERRDDTIIWFLDGREYGRFKDPIPLVGDHHDRFGFSSWEAQLLFDNLKVEAL